MTDDKRLLKVMGGLDLKIKSDRKVWSELFSKLLTKTQQAIIKELVRRKK